MTYLEIALAVLKAARRPMTVHEIVEWAVAEGLWSPV
jgi:hypothetical protein